MGCGAFQSRCFWNLIHLHFSDYRARTCDFLGSEDQGGGCDTYNLFVSDGCVFCGNWDGMEMDLESGAGDREISP